MELRGMSPMTGLETRYGPLLDRIAKLGVIPVVELQSSSQAMPLLEALLAAGLGVVEITLRSSAALEAIHVLRTRYPDALVGAGTVRSVEDSRAVIDAGADFVVSPVTNVDVIASCQSRNVCVIPGGCTPTEIDTAVRAGAAAVKFFPAEASGGVRYLSALSGPFPDVRYVPTGGINATNLADYLRHPQVLACGGSWLVTRTLLEGGDFDQVTVLAQEAIAIVSQARGMNE
jgi:2-dehydro-3-deoxyphosphogluconate aldolase / (4S)-4-hydroxy-2-oxoglutarate aldolase